MLGCFAKTIKLGLIVVGLLFAVFVILVFTSPSSSTSRSSPSTVHYAWIEARETCPSSSEYKQMIGTGARVWSSPGNPSSANVRHGTPVDILSRDGDWVYIEYGSQKGYVQSFFVVGYNPSKEFKPSDASCFK